ncbi:MAG: flagellar hook-basal body complex protein FliE [Gammaproteobacteria bacterium]
MADMAIQSVLAQMRAMQSRAEGIQPNAVQAPSNNFTTVMKSAVEHVSETQKAAAEMTKAYESGKNVEIADVMVSLQKSSIQFQATVQVRNKMVEAYQQIMNMPI